MGDYFYLRITDSVKDSKPFYEKKNVVLCRSGIQEYSYAEVCNFGLGNPRVVKDSYKVYRPASVLIACKDKMANLPLTKEHPPEFVDGENWNRYAQGYTGSEIDIVPIGDGEIGVKGKVCFSTNAIYNYYLEGNQEVSLGYVSKNEWVDDPDKTGYDIIMVGIEDVNHLAVTAAGRGGSRVAVIDSILGGITMFKTGLFHFLKQKGQTTDSATPFSKIVIDSLEQSKTMDSTKLEAEVTRVLDSLATLKDGESKTLLMDSVADCYKAIDTALANKEDVGKFLDSVYAKAEKETLDSLPKAEDSKVEDKKVEDASSKVLDMKVEDKKDEDKEDEDKKDGEVKDEDGKGTGTTNVSDSVVATVQDAIKASNEELMKVLDAKIASGIKTALGLEDDKATGGAITDSVADTNIDVDIAKYVL